MDWTYLLDSFLEILRVTGGILFVVFFFGMCIFTHELGHFLVAKWRGLHIDAFSIGFKKIWSKKINGVEYRIGCLPLGGYVELPQVDGSGTPHAADGTELPAAKPLDRVLTAAAGPICNIIFGLLLGCVVWIVGIPQDSPKMREIEVAKIIDIEHSPEYAAGLREGDKIVKLNGNPFNLTWSEFTKEILTTIDEVALEINRNGETLHIAYLPAVNPNVSAKLRVEQAAIPFFLPRLPIELHPEKDSPAAQAGIRAGDRLLSINGIDFEDLGGVQMMISCYGDQPLQFQLRRSDNSEYTTTVIAEPLPDTLDFMTEYLLGLTHMPDGTVVSLLKDFPAEQAGILPGDKILSVAGKQITPELSLYSILQELRDTPFDLTIERAGNAAAIQLTIAAKPIVPRTIGVRLMLRDHPNPFQQFTSLIDLTVKSIRGIGIGIGNKLGVTKSQSTLKLRNMSGPAGMVWILYQSVQFSLMTGLYFVVIISFALAIFNLLPLPVLDGGHIFMGLLEIIFHRSLPQVIVKGLTILFIGLLILLMVYVTFIDFLRIFARETPAQPEPTTSITTTEPAVAPETAQPQK